MAILYAEAVEAKGSRLV